MLAKKSFVLLWALLLGAAGHADDQDFLAAREAYRTSDLKALGEYSAKLQGDLFAVYGDYYWLSRQLATADSIAVTTFLQKHSDTWLAEKLRGEWLQLLGQRGDWANYLHFYPGLARPEPEHKCYNYSARINTGDQKAPAEAKAEFWLATQGLPAACQTLLQNLQQSGAISADDYWLKLRLALQGGSAGLSRTVAGKLGIDLTIAQLDQINRTPKTYLARPDVETAIGHELYLAALARYARQDLEQALAYWEGVQHRFGRDDKAYGWRLLALAAAKQFDPRAIDWFKLSEPAYWPVEDRELAIRSAVRAQQWDEVLAFINGLSSERQQERAWRYWRARAIEAGADKNKAKTAQALYTALALDDDYYGLLARDRLGNRISAQPKTYELTDQDRQAANANAGIQRALRLYQLDLRTEAVREWNWSLRTADDRLLLAAADQASTLRWYDRAIYAAERTKQLHSYSLRYLTPYKEVTRGYAQELGLDPAWVYGLIRQESRFITNAKSGVGAGGLMQLMPSTAQWVANRINIPYHADMVNDVGTNVRLGTYYINHVFQQLGSQPVLATAGYNAGPTRARRWQDPDRALPVDVYTESIPYTETRDYVKKVMTNAVHYALGFGQGPQSLTERMGKQIPARAGKEVTELVDGGTVQPAP